MKNENQPSVLLLDGRFLSDRVRAHTVLKDFFGFPSFYGANLDALFDCLSTCGETRVAVYFASRIRLALGEYGDDLISTLLDAARENDALKVAVYE